MKIIIEGSPWNVYFVPEESAELWIESYGRYAIGACHIDTQEIFIADDLDCELMLEVVQHEISHAYYAMEGLPSMISEEDLAIFSGRFADDISETAEYIMEDCDCEY